MRRIATAVGGGAALGLAYRPHGPWGLLAAPALALLLAATEGLPALPSFGVGAVFGALAYACGMPWLYQLTARWLHLPPALALSAAAFLWTGQGLVWGLTAASGAAAGEGWRRALGVAAAGVAAECYAPAIFPVPIAATQLFNAAGVQCVCALGVAAIAWLLFFAAACLDALRRRDPLAGRATAALLVAASVNEAWGARRLSELARLEAAAPHVEAAIVQAGSDDTTLARPGAITARTDLYPLLTRRAPPADLVVWPESSFAAPLRYDSASLGSAEAGGRPLQRALAALVGDGPALVLNAVGRAADGGLRNVALAVDRTRRPLGVSEKALLMPFGEYMPFGALGERLRALSPMTGRATPGRLAVLDVGGARVGVMICYENMLPWPAFWLASSGADLLAAQVNDAWFDGTLGPEHHLLFGRLRAIETGRAILHAANTGVSAVIEPSGEVSARLEPGVTGTLVARVPLLRGQQTSFRVNAALRLLALAASTLLSLDGWRRRRAAA